MGIFGPKKHIVEDAKKINEYIITSNVYVDKKDIDGLYDYLCEVGASARKWENNLGVDFVFPDIPFDFHVGDLKLYIVGKEKYFGIFINKGSTGFSVQAKNEVSAAGYPTTKDAILLKNYLAKYYHYDDISEYI